MKKYLLGLIPAAIIGAIFLVTPAYKEAEKPYLGDAESIGSEDDATERLTYEWSMLHDPATGKIPAHARERELAFAATLPHDGLSSFVGKTTDVPWNNRGPWNVGGRTRALAIDVADENVLIAGSCSGGMWRSTDQGASWTKTSTNTQPLSVSCVAQDTRAGHTNVWYYGSGEAYGASAGTTGAYYLGNGIYKSTDNGVSWTVLPSTTTGSLTTFDTWADLTWTVATDPSNTVDDEVYAAASGGIYRSADGGTSWTRVKGNGSGHYFTDVAVSPTGIVYATLSSDGAYKGLYRSTDGTTFTNITPAGFATSYNRIRIGICPDDENQVYFLGNTPGYGQPDTNYVGDIEWNSLWKYNYVSGDGSGTGGVWRDLSSNLPSTGGPFDKYSCQGSYDIVVKVKPGDSNSVFIGGTCLYRSTSGFKDNANTTFIGGYQEGATLPVVGMYTNHHPDQHDLVFFPSDSKKMLSCNDGGIFRTTDNSAPSVAWTSLNNGYLNSMFYSCAIDHAETNDIVIGGAQDNGSWYTNSSSGTAPWVTPRGGDGSYCAIADHGSVYYFSIQNGKMMKAKLNASGGVDSFARIDPIGGKGYQFINPYVLDPNNNNIMYLVAGRCLWRNNDLSGIPYAGNWDSISTNWTKFNDSLPVASLKITAVAVSKTPANRVYYGTSARRLYRVDGANVGSPTPVDITSTTGTAVFPGGNISCIAVDPDNADNVMVVFSNYGVYSLFYSSNGGTSWSKVAGNLETASTGSGEGPSCRWASIMPVPGGTVYLVGTSVGLFATTQLQDASTVWTQMGTNTIGNSVVDMIDYRQTDGLVVVATHSHGIFSGHISHVADVNAVIEAASSKSNIQLNNYPNPFTGETNIQFELSHNDYVSLKVYDINGKLISTLADGQFSPGAKRFTFGGPNIVPGVYFCTLKTGDKTTTRKLVVAQ